MIFKNFFEDRDYFKFIVYGLMIFSVLLFLILSRKAKVAIWVSIFIFVNMVMTSYKKIIRLRLEIELLTLGIVLCTVSFGVKAGLVVAILGGILSFFVGLDINPFIFPMFVGYVMMVFTSYLLDGMNITYIGIFTSLINNLFVFLIYHLLFGYEITKNLR